MRRALAMTGVALGCLLLAGIVGALVWVGITVVTFLAALAGVIGWFLVLILLSAVLLVVMAVTITPAQRRDTRASVYPFQSGVVVVNITVYDQAQLPAAARRAVPSGGLPDVVEGQIVDSQMPDRERT